MLEHFPGEPEGVGQTQEFQEKDPGETRAWEIQERMAKGRRALTVHGCCQAPLGFWGSGIVPAGPVRTLGPSR